MARMLRLVVGFDGATTTTWYDVGQNVVCRIHPKE